VVAVRLVAADLFLEGAEGGVLGFVGEKLAAVLNGLEEAAGRTGPDGMGGKGVEEHGKDLRTLVVVSGGSDGAVMHAPVSAEVSRGDFFFRIDGGVGGG
jgi:hypothetical protein